MALAPALQQFTTVDSAPAVVAATAHLTPLRERRVQLEAEQQAAHRIAGAGRLVPGDEIYDEEATLRARLKLAHIEDEMLSLRLEELPAARALQSAREAARQELAEAIAIRQREAVARLAAALEHAAQANEVVVQLDQDLEGIVGTSAPRFAWHELSAESPTCDSRLASWQRHVKAHGL